MRPIEFRAWNKKTKKMIDLKKATPLAVGSFDGIFIPFHDDLEIMQFTGMLDRNGKKIFEGDIVEVDFYSPKLPEILTVVFSGPYKYAAFGITGKRNIDKMGDGADPVWDTFNERYCKHLKVLGNIYETPELLEEL